MQILPCIATKLDVFFMKGKEKPDNMIDCPALIWNNG